MNGVEANVHQFFPAVPEEAVHPRIQRRDGVLKTDTLGEHRLRLLRH